MSTTWSIIARAERTGRLGIVVASKFFAVGAHVPHIKAGVGAGQTISYEHISAAMQVSERATSPSRRALLGVEQLSQMQRQPFKATQLHRPLVK
jgi:hypothetical protein